MTAPNDRTPDLMPSDLIFQIFGQRVKEERVKKGLSQEQFAELLLISDDTIGRIERGNSVRLDVAFQIAWVLKVPFQQLLPQQENVHKTIEDHIAVLLGVVNFLEESKKSEF